MTVTATMSPKERYQQELADIEVEVRELTIRKAQIVLRLQLAPADQQRRGAGERQREVLDFLEEHGSSSCMEIAWNLVMSRQNAHKALCGLVERGLVERYGRLGRSTYGLTV